MQHADKAARALAESSEKQADGGHRGAATGVHNSPRMVAQRQLVRSLFGQSAQLKGGELDATGLPGELKAGIESLSGRSLDPVEVHYNSSQPAQLNALAFAQGNHIHLAPGQERHLPHEAWHVVQQAQGRVEPTGRLTGGVSVNDDPALEQEADVMGMRALQMRPTESAAPSTGRDEPAAK